MLLCAPVVCMCVLQVPTVLATVASVVHPYTVAEAARRAAGAAPGMVHRGWGESAVRLHFIIWFRPAHLSMDIAWTALASL